MAEIEEMSPLGEGEEAKAPARFAKAVAAVSGKALYAQNRTPSGPGELSF